MKSIFMQVSAFFILIIFSTSNPSHASNTELNKEKRVSSVDKVFISPILGAKFVLIPAGSYTMGAPRDEICQFYPRYYVNCRSPLDHPYDEHQHQVTISRPFYMQTTEVTQGQWRQVMGNNPSYFSDCGDSCPVENVSWDDVQEFISKLNSIEVTSRYRLPTEAEWEYAARAGSQAARYGDIEDIAWYSGNSGAKTHTVGQKKPNAWGLYDMLGNVWEWCQDWKDYYPLSSVIDPTGPASEEFRIQRGSSCTRNEGWARAAIRAAGRPCNKLHDVGFRLIKVYQ